MLKPRWLREELKVSEFVEIVFNFDTTGSMYPVLMEVRKKLQQTIGTLFKELPNLRVGIGANGDYCDRSRTYVTAHTDLTTNLDNLQKFVMDVKPTGGGANGGEAYELALHETRTKYSWSKDSRKILVMIGDEVAHTVNYYGNTNRLNWIDEAKALRDQGIEIYTIQALDRRDQSAASYYARLAELGGGVYLRLDQFTDIVELVMAITYRQIGVERVEQYEQLIASTKNINRSLDRSFSVLAGRTISYDQQSNSLRFVQADVDGDLVPVSSGRFQMLDVDHDILIKQFVEDNKLPFKTGRGFYEFTKREEVQPNKEVVLRDLRSGDMFCGKQARNIIGIPFGQRGFVKPSASSQYQVFIQSTSYNRKLKAGNKFLYEVDTAL